MDYVSTSSQLVSQLSTPNFLIGFLSMLATVLGTFFTVTAIILGFLVWKQDELRKKAEADVKKTEAITKEVSGLWLETKSRSDKVAKILVEAEKNVAAVQDALRQAKDGKARISEASESVNAMLAELEKTRISLVTASGTLADYSRMEDYLTNWSKIRMNFPEQEKNAVSTEAIRKILEPEDGPTS